MAVKGVVGGKKSTKGSNCDGWVRLQKSRIWWSGDTINVWQWSKSRCWRNIVRLGHGGNKKGGERPFISFKFLWTFWLIKTIVFPERGQAHSSGNVWTPGDALLLSLFPFLRLFGMQQVGIALKRPWFLSRPWERLLFETLLRTDGRCAVESTERMAFLACEAWIQLSFSWTLMAVVVTSNAS